jgi:hypothetical protein
VLGFSLLLQIPNHTCSEDVNLPVGATLVVALSSLVVAPMGHLEKGNHKGCPYDFLFPYRCENDLAFPGIPEMKCLETIKFHFRTGMICNPPWAKKQPIFIFRPLLIANPEQHK